VTQCGKAGLASFPGFEDIRDHISNKKEGEYVMKATFDLRSLLVGVALAALVFLALGASLNAPAQVDRFRIATSANHVFVIDTATGQVWTEYIVPRQDTRDQQFMTPRLPLEKH
jgi:hypothetical protein